MQFMKHGTKALLTAVALTSASLGLAPQVGAQETYPAESLMAVIDDHEELDTFAALLVRAGLDDLLADPDVSFTIYAPDDAAFESLSVTTLAPSWVAFSTQ